MNRRQPLRRGKPLRRQSSLPPVSDRRRNRDAGYDDARQAVLRRSGGRCEACAVAWLPGCNGQVEQVHHVAGRGGSDPHRLDSFLGVSADHHAAIHANPAESYRLGLMRRRNGVAA